MEPDALDKLAKLAEPISKLIETVANGCGALFEPRQIRNRAKAEADALKISTEAKIQAQDMEDRAQIRRQYLETRRQRNLEAIIRQAADQMPDEVSSQPVDEDWIVDFFEQCQDVGDETLQSLWARLLAGEVTNPGSVSRRTLHTVKMMDKRDANLFTKLACLVWEVPKQSAHLLPDNIRLYVKIIKQVGLHLSDFSHLVSIGLLETAKFTGNVPVRVGDQIWSYCGTRLRISATVRRNWLAITLSQVGTELLPISGAVACPEYFDCFLKSMNTLHYTAKILESEP